jgi:hypothetical protein
MSAPMAFPPAIRHRPASRSRKAIRRKWDSLDISMLIESVLDSFASEFYGCHFDQLTDHQSRRVLNAIGNHVRELRRAA